MDVVTHGYVAAEFIKLPGLRFPEHVADYCGYARVFQPNRTALRVIKNAVQSDKRFAVGFDRRITGYPRGRSGQRTVQPPGDE
jgi:hypothetical protein